MPSAEKWARLVEVFYLKIIKFVKAIIEAQIKKTNGPKMLYEFKTIRMQKVEEDGATVHKAIHSTEMGSKKLCFGYVIILLASCAENDGI